MPPRAATSGLAIGKGLFETDITTRLRLDEAEVVVTEGT